MKNNFLGHLITTWYFIYNCHRKDMKKFSKGKVKRFVIITAHFYKKSKLFL